MNDNQPVETNKKRRHRKRNKKAGSGQAQPENGSVEPKSSVEAVAKKHAINTSNDFHPENSHLEQGLTKKQSCSNTEMAAVISECVQEIVDRLDITSDSDTSAV